MSGLKPQVILINDRRYCIGPCEHCDESASEMEALKAFTDWTQWLGVLPSCAICGVAIPITEVSLIHKVVGDSPEALAWRVHFVAFDKCLSFTSFNGVDVGMHDACARVSLPHAHWELLGRVVHHQYGRRRMPWDTGFRERVHGELAGGEK